MYYIDPPRLAFWEDASVSVAYPYAPRLNIQRLAAPTHSLCWNVWATLYPSRLIGHRRSTELFHLAAVYSRMTATALFAGMQ